jgi:thiamine biosynthesis lipoprotein
MSVHYTFDAIGTRWQIDILDECKAEESETLLKIIKQRIEIFDKAYSRFRPDSLIAEMAEKAGEYILPNDAQPMFDLYEKLYRQTEGRLTPLIGQVLVDAGYDTVYSLKQHKPLEPPPAWDEVLEYTYPKLTLKKPALLDFGAAGKGYIVDMVAALLKSKNIYNFCIDAGGDIVHSTIYDTSMRIGLENPYDTTQVIGIIELKNKSICGSAGNRRAWGTFTHIIDPHTLTSPQSKCAIWVLADTALVADALASCLFFVSPVSLKKQYDFEYLILYSDFSIEISKDFNAELFMA